ncbi:hypothetical protein TIFTF001_013743 [Ficus carica]|uniref:Uncharacterized protein n=1 Tax=Ficus carica TaxID=3494 RepID=A0AA88D4Z2_FICCA|nr:hypothetical protein TIFTF001_013743 [Ficus carica]
MTGRGKALKISALSVEKEKGRTGLGSGIQSVWFERKRGCVVKWGPVQPEIQIRPIELHLIKMGLEGPVDGSDCRSEQLE